MSTAVTCDHTHWAGASTSMEWLTANSLTGMVFNQKRALKYPPRGRLRRQPSWRTGRTNRFSNRPEAIRLRQAFVRRRVNARSTDEASGACAADAERGPNPGKRAKPSRVAQGPPVGYFNARYAIRVNRGRCRHTTIWQKVAA